MLRITKGKIISGFVAAILAVLLAGIGIFLLQKEKRVGSTMHRPTDPGLSQIYDEAIRLRDDINRNPTDSENYLHYGFNMKSLGDYTNDHLFYEEARAVYQEGAARFGRTEYVFALNYGQVSILLNQLEAAERAYRMAIEVFPDDYEPYRALIELYRNYSVRPTDTVVNVYEDALKLVKVSQKKFVMHDYAYFLKSVGRNVRARAMFADLLEIEPLNREYRNEVKELIEKRK